jgi:hypothetical protein
MPIAERAPRRQALGRIGPAAVAPAGGVAVGVQLVANGQARRGAGGASMGAKAILPPGLPVGTPAGRDTRARHLDPPVRRQLLDEQPCHAQHHGGRRAGVLAKAEGRVAAG